MLSIVTATGCDSSGGRYTAFGALREPNGPPPPAPPALAPAIRAEVLPLPLAAAALEPGGPPTLVTLHSERSGLTSALPPGPAASLARRELQLPPSAESSPGPEPVARRADAGCPLDDAAPPAITAAALSLRPRATTEPAAVVSCSARRAARDPGGGLSDTLAGGAAAALPAPKPPATAAAAAAAALEGGKRGDVLALELTTADAAPEAADALPPAKAGVGCEGTLPTRPLIEPVRLPAKLAGVTAAHPLADASPRRLLLLPPPPRPEPRSTASAGCAGCCDGWRCDGLVVTREAPPGAVPRGGGPPRALLEGEPVPVKGGEPTDDVGEALAGERPRALADASPPPSSPGATVRPVSGASSGDVRLGPPFSTRLDAGLTLGPAEIRAPNPFPDPAPGAAALRA